MIARQERIILPSDIPSPLVLRPSAFYHKVRSHFHRVSSSTIIMVKDVMKNYALDFSTKGIKPTRGKRGINIIVDTVDGKKLLKKYNHKLDKTTIIHEHSILNHLKDLNFSSPRLVMNKIGESITLHKNRYYALFDFFEGLYQCRDYFFLSHRFGKYLKIAGEMLGSLHEQLKDFVPEGYNPDGFRAKDGDRRRDLQWHLDKLDNCIEQNQKLNQGSRKNRQIGFLEKSDDLKKRLIRLDTLLNEANLVKGNAVVQTH